MKKLLQKGLLLALFLGCLSTLFLTWFDASGVQTIDGLNILTKNLFLSVLICGLYGIGVLFFEKAPKTMFCLGLSSLSMLFALYVSRFESYGRFGNQCAGPYLGISAVFLTGIVYVLTTRRLASTEKQ